MHSAARTVESLVNSPWRRIGVVAVVAVLPYLALPAGPLLLDAPLAVLANETVQSGPLHDVLAKDFWGFPPDAEFGTRSYRPLVTLTYALQARLVGNSAALYHAADMLLHALAAVLVLLLAERLGLRPGWAVAAGMLFGVHPAHSEAVISVVGRADILAGAGLLAALLFFLEARTRRRSRAWDAAGLACLGASLLCKEYAVVFPFLVVAADLALSRAAPAGAGRTRSRWPVWIAAFLVLGAYLVLRRALFGAVGGVPMLTAADHPLFDAPIEVRWAMAARLMLLAGRLLIFPFGLNHHYRYGTLPIVEGPLDPRALAGLALLVALLGLALWASRRFRSPVPAVAFLLFCLPPLPALNTVSLSGMVFAERFLYLPVAGLALCVAWVGSRAARGRTAAAAAAVLLGCLLLTLAGLTARRVLEWGSAERLARASLARYPGGSEVWTDLGLALGRQGRHEEAVTALQRALEIQPGHPRTWQVYGAALVAAGRFDEGAAAWRRSIELAGDGNGALWRGLGEAQLLGGELDAARDSLLRARALLPGDAPTLGLLATAHLRSGRPEEAVSLLREGLSETPALATLRPLLGQALLRLGQQRLAGDDAASALELAREAVRLEALPPDGLFLAGLLAARAGDRGLARAWIDQALSADPALLVRKREAAARLEREGRLLDAASMLGEILAADPTDTAALFDLGRVLLLAGQPARAVPPLRRGLELEEDERARALLDRALREAGAAAEP